METLEEKIKRVLADAIKVVPYDHRWPDLFEEEKEHLFSCLPLGLVMRVEHFCSIAIPGISSKPIIDMLVKVTKKAKIYYFFISDLQYIS